MMNQLAKDVQLSQQAVELLNQQHTLSIELKKHLTDRAKDLQAQLDKLNQAKEHLEEKMKEQPQPSSDIFQVDPKKISETTKKVVEEIIRTDKGTKKARCNEGVNMVYEQLTGNTDLAGKRANEMIKHMSKSPHWEKITTMSRAHELAQDGYIVVVGWHSQSVESGHVAVVVPGDMVKSKEWGCPVPLTMDTGGSARQASGMLSQGFGADKQPEIEFYVYKGPISKK
jgi:uncharacterized protein YbjQ (UPF0145 family)